MVSANNFFVDPEPPRKNELAWGNRDPLEIMYAMLQTCENGALKTHIMYQSNLNSKQVQNYLDTLLNSRLVEKELNPAEQRYVYVTTFQGKKFLQTYDEMRGILA